MVTYSFELTQKFLSKNEQGIFDDYLQYLGLDDSIWQVFSHLFKCTTESSTPYVLKAYANCELKGAIILLKCKRYGKSLFDSKLLHAFVDFLGIPIFLWLKLGCGMDLVSNPGFVKCPEESEDIFREMISYLKKKNKLLIVNDYADNYKCYNASFELPALPHGFIDTSLFKNIDDYLKKFKNIKRKIRVFKRKDGNFQLFHSRLNERQIAELKKCFITTTNKSVFYLPYQDLYFKLAMISSDIITKNVIYFIATHKDEIIGYQAALKSGSSLRILHGAFYRDKKTLYHAYDILFVKMTEFAIKNKLQIIDVGVVINYTKQRMVNKSKEMSYFLIAKYPWLQFALKSFLKLTKLQGKTQLDFARPLNLSILN